MRYLLLPAAAILAAFGPAGDEDLCMRCHGNTPPAAAQNGLEAPRLPEAYAMTWDMFEFQHDARPPVAAIPTPHAVIRGTTYYDWNRRSMTEVYQERCIDIFPDGHDYPCRFTSIGSRTYFIRHAKAEPARVDSCCLWRESEFWAPRPDVLRNMSFDRDMPYESLATRWWTLDAPLPGPFGYGIADGRPVAFWFPVISGWVQQVFHDYRAETPPPEAFRLPAECRAEALPVCG